MFSQPLRKLALLNTLGQRTDKIKNDYCDHGRSGHHQHNHALKIEPLGTVIALRRMIRYLKNIKLEMSNFDGRLDLQYYLDWIMSLEYTLSGTRCLKNDESVLPL